MSCMPLGHPSAIYQSSQCKSPQVRFVGLVWMFQTMLRAGLLGFDSL
jgi:hypothetical protein